MDASTVAVVLPCLDESLALPRVLAGFPDGYVAVVVANGSSDGSAAVAARCGAIVVHEPQKGYVAAVHTGLAACSADIVAVMDCDAPIDPADLAGLVAAVSEGRSYLACGRRRAVTSGAWPWHARIGNGVLAWVLGRSSALTVHDLVPVRVARRARLVELGVLDRRSGYPVETLLRARRGGLAHLRTRPIGGDPVALLRRCRNLLSAPGTVLLDLEPPGSGLLIEQVRLEDSGRPSEPFRWCWLGVDSLPAIAAAAGLTIRCVWPAGDQWQAELEPGTRAPPDATRNPDGPPLSRTDREE